MRNGYFWDAAAHEYFVPRGIAYQTWNTPVYANQSFQQLDYDLLEFKKMYANSVRVDLAWGELETSEGVYDWRKPDHLVETAEALGLKLFVLIGYQYPPNWFPAEWRGTNDHGLLSNVLNYEHPEARRAYARHIAAVTEHYKASRAIAGWILGNEYAYFDLWEPLAPGESHRMLGYDSLSQASFRTFLRSAYGGDIASMNARWGTAYPDFDSVVMPRAYPSNRNNPVYHDLIQWRKLSIGNLVAAGAVAARQADPNHLFTYSMVGLVYSTDDDNNACEDAHTIVTRCQVAGAPLDFWSINNYAWSKLGSELRTADFGIAKYQAQSGLPLMISETGYSDTENQYSGARERHAKAVPSQLWEAVLSGAIGVHLFHWNDRDQFAGNFIRERGFGIVRQDRTIKEPVYSNVLKVYRRMEEMKLERLLGGSANPKPDIQLFWSTNADMGWPRANYENASLWGALRRLGYQPGIIDDTQFERGAATNAAALVLSRCYQMNPLHLDLIAEQVIPAGVHVYANADLPGQFNAYHRSNSNWIDRMNFIFGVDVRGVRAGLDGGVTGTTSYQRIRFRGTGSRETFGSAYSDYLDTWKVWYGVQTAASGTTIVTDTGINNSQPATPALVFKDHGGAKTAINTFALGDTAPIGKEEPPLTHDLDLRFRWLQTVFGEHFGLTPSIGLTGPGASYVFPDYRICANGSILISLLNGHTNSATLTVTAPVLLSGKTVENLSSGGILETDSGGRLTLSLDGDDYVLLYVYPSHNGVDQSLINPNPNKLWFESAPTTVWPNGQAHGVTIGFDTLTEGLHLHVGLESLHPSGKSYGETTVVVPVGKGTQSLQVMIPEADLNDPNYASSRAGGRYVWRAWLDNGGALTSEIRLPVRLLWGVCPTALPAAVTPGRTYPVTLEWQELPSYGGPTDYPVPLNRAALWDSLQAGVQRYNVILELQSGGRPVTTNGFVTSDGTSNHQFQITVPRNATGPFAWFARVYPATNLVSHDVQDSFEGRTLGALTTLLAQDTNAISPLTPWQSYHYPTNGTQQWLDEGIQLEGSDGSQSAFLIVTNPAPPLGYSGFGIRYLFDHAWSLPVDWRIQTNYTFSCDFRLLENRRCLVELQIKNEDPGGLGKWIQVSEEYHPGSNGWHSISAPLKQFARPLWSYALFDPSRITEIVVNIQMLDSNVLYEASFDNLRFDGPDAATSFGEPVAIYDSHNDSPPALADADRDGIPDAYETGTGIYVSPTDTGSNPNQADSDGDGQSDGQELIAGTDPNRRGDVLSIQSIRRNSDGSVMIGWSARIGRTYQIYYCDGDMTDGQFWPLGNQSQVTVNTDGPVEIVDPSAAGSEMRFYRISVQMP